MQVRRAIAADVDRVCELAGWYAQADACTLPRDRVRQAFIPLLADDAYGVVLVVEVDTEIVGYAVLTWGYGIESGGVEALLDEFFVARPGLGLGTALVTAVLESACAHGARTIFLETEAANAGARAFWSRFDFAVEDSVWMRRELTS